MDQWMCDDKVVLRVAASFTFISKTPRAALLRDKACAAAAAAVMQQLNKFSFVVTY